MPAWELRACVCICLYPSSTHVSNIDIVINITTKHVSTRNHATFNGNFNITKCVDSTDKVPLWYNLVADLLEYITNQQYDSARIYYEGGIIP